MSFWVRVRRYFADNPVELILNPVPSRLMMLGAITAAGHIVYYLIWHKLEPSLFESLPLRLFMACTGLVFTIPAFHNNPESTTTKGLFVLLVFLQVPVFFFFMYLMNDGHRVWLASAALIIVALYGLTDWRVATTEVVLGAPVAGGLWLLFCPPGQRLPLSAEDAAVFVFAVICGVSLGVFTATTRQLRLKHSNELMGILAHELRTPLSANGLLGEAIQAQSLRLEPGAVRTQLQNIAGRIQALTNSMNHHIDLQIINGNILQMPKSQERIVASELVELAVEQYPFRSMTQRQGLLVTVDTDFTFAGSPLYFNKVLDNLIANALKSLQAANSNFEPGVLVINVTKKNGQGVITVADRGMGIDPSAMHHLFKAYHSTDRQANHGLGLYFCRRVVESAGGTITAKSAHLIGAKFEIRLPLMADPSWRTLRNSAASLGANAPDSAGLDASTRPMTEELSRKLW